MPGLRGAYCELCTNSSEQYYVPASDAEAAHCLPCVDVLQNIGWNSIYFIVPAAVLAAVVALVFRFRYQFAQSMLRRATLAQERYSLSIKLKILIGFCVSSRC